MKRKDKNLKLFCSKTYTGHICIYSFPPVQMFKINIFAFGLYLFYTICFYNTTIVLLKYKPTTCVNIYIIIIYKLILISYIKCDFRIFVLMDIYTNRD